MIQKAFLTLVAFLSLTGIGQAATSESTPKSWREKIETFLRPGWEVTQTNNSVIITRKEPVTYYNPISLPPFKESRERMIENSKYTEKFQITLDFAEKMSELKYKEIEASNLKSEKQFEARKKSMRSFYGKGNYQPKTSEDNALYEEYLTDLANLPYLRLPDLHDQKHSIYINVVFSRLGWRAFYSSQEELECFSVVTNIYSLAEAHGDNQTPEAMKNTFYGHRPYDLYLVSKEVELKNRKE